MGRLNGRTALITGGGNGIGRAIALKFAREGAQVMIADIDLPSAQAVASEIAGFGGIAQAFQLDVADRAMVWQTIDQIHADFRGLDILVNNAGVLSSTPIEAITDDEWDRVLDINLKSVFLLCQASLDLLKLSGRGRIINMASNAGRDGGVSTGVHYVSSKAGVIGLTRGLAKRLAECGITCNCIAPGTTKSDMLKEFTPEMLKNIESTIPLKRLGEPDDIAELACLVASDNGAFMTGAVLDINGGLFIG